MNVAGPALIFLGWKHPGPIEARTPGSISTGRQNFWDGNIPVSIGITSSSVDCSIHGFSTSSWPVSFVGQPTRQYPNRPSSPVRLQFIRPTSPVWRPFSFPWAVGPDQAVSFRQLLHKPRSLGKKTGIKRCSPASYECEESRLLSGFLPTVPTDGGMSKIPTKESKMSDYPAIRMGYTVISRG